MLYNHKIIYKLPKRCGQQSICYCFQRKYPMGLRMNWDSLEISFLLIRALGTIVWKSCLA